MVVGLTTQVFMPEEYGKNGFVFLQEHGCYTLANTQPKMGHNASKLEEEWEVLHDAVCDMNRKLKGATPAKRAILIAYIVEVQKKADAIREKIGTPPSSPKPNAVTA